MSCKIREMSDSQAYEIQLTENIQRKSMDPVEKGGSIPEIINIDRQGKITETLYSWCIRRLSHGFVGSL